MTTKTLSQLINAATVIHDETTDAANTATRVGDLFADIVNYMQQCLLPDSEHIRVTQSATNVQVTFLLNKIEAGDSPNTSFTITIPAATEDGAGVVSASFKQDVKADAVNAAKEYTDTKAATTLNAANFNAAAKAASALNSAKTYADTKAATTLKEAKTYTDKEAGNTLTEAKAYTDAKLKAALANIGYNGNDTGLAARVAALEALLMLN